MLLARASRLMLPVLAALGSFVQSAKAYQVLVSDQDEVRSLFAPPPRLASLLNCLVLAPHRFDKFAVGCGVKAQRHHS